MRHNILIIVFIALLNISGWLVLHQRPHMAADISYPFASISFEPNHPYNHNPERPEDISEEQLEEDFKKIAGKTRCVRIYRPTNGMEKVPEIAQKYNMTVIAGTWFDGNNAKKNQREFDALMQMVNDNSNITHLLIGNEIPFVRMQKEQEDVRDKQVEMNKAELEATIKREKIEADLRVEDTKAAIDLQELEQKSKSDAEKNYTELVKTVRDTRKQNGEKYSTWNIPSFTGKKIIGQP